MRERMKTDKLQIVDVGSENVDTCRCCGANRLGQQRKREWIKQCLPYGLRYKTVLEQIGGRTVGMIEYMPSEYAWRSAHAMNYMMIHCLQVAKQYRGRGIGSRLIQDCKHDAEQRKMNGVVALATTHGWCADDRVYLKNGFRVVDNASPSLKLVAKQLRKAQPPSFGDWKERLEKMGTGIYMYCSKQCPFMRREELLAHKEWLKTKYGLEAKIIEINSHEQAQANPCVWGTSGIICNREIINYVSGGRAPLLKKLRQMQL
jgi:GNAT superfamily N-acetyltransferase